MINTPDLVNEKSEAAKELKKLNEDLNLLNLIFIQDVVQSISSSAIKIYNAEIKKERNSKKSLDMMDQYIQNTLGCILEDWWDQQEFSGRNQKTYIRILLCSFADGEKHTIDVFKRHAEDMCEENVNFMERFQYDFEVHFADIFYFDNPKALWSEIKNMLPRLGLPIHMCLIEGGNDCRSTVADVLTDIIINDMYHKTEEGFRKY